jgi:hypothetical protein
VNERLRDVTASVMTLGALAVISYAAIIQNDATAKGALISILAAATGWFLRGRVETPKS